MSDEAGSEENKDDFESHFNQIAEEGSHVPGDELENGDPGDAPKDETEIIQKDDPYAGMSDEAKDKFIALEESNTKLQHRISSDDGRVGALQRKINGMEEAAELIQTAPTEDEIKGAMASDEQWDKFSEDYPEVSAAIDGRLSKHSSDVDSRFTEQASKINTQLAPVIEINEQAEIEKSIGIVADEFPSWQNAVQEADYAEWVGSQNAVIQNLGSSDNPEDALSLMSLYDTHRIANDLPSMKDDPDHVDNTVVNRSTTTQQKRERQLDDGVTLPSKGAKIDPNADAGTDFDNAFDVFARKNDSKRQA